MIIRSIEFNFFRHIVDNKWKILLGIIIVVLSIVSAVSVTMEFDDPQKALLYYDQSIYNVIVGKSNLFALLLRMLLFSLLYCSIISLSGFFIWTLLVIPIVLFYSVYSNAIIAILIIRVFGIAGIFATITYFIYIIILIALMIFVSVYTVQKCCEFRRYGCINKFFIELANRGHELLPLFICGGIVIAVNSVLFYVATLGITIF